MWKATAGTTIISKNDDDEDWETDPDFINNVTEQEQRWGSKTIEGSGRTVGAIDMNKLREETTKAYELQKLKQKEDAPNAAYGYGGKFGIEKDRMDKSAVGHDYVAKIEKHMSQTDYNTGFGGKFGVQTDRVDKSAVSWDHKENIEKHASQKDYSSGFGGKFGIEKDRQDKSAVGWDHIEKLHKHDSQTVGKNNDNIVEQMQKPSELKAKFESLAKQNEVKNVDRKKPISKLKITSVVDNPATMTSITPDTGNLESVSATTNTFDDTASKNNRERETHKAHNLEEKMSQMKLTEPNQTPSFVSNEEELNNKRQNEIQVVETNDVPLDTPYHQNEMNTNLNKEEMYEPLDGSYTAVALFDYQAAADDEISFDPDDIITNIEQIDEGWWRGTCNGLTGLFPANYVQLCNVDTVLHSAP